MPDMQTFPQTMPLLIVAYVCLFTLARMIISLLTWRVARQVRHLYHEAGREMPLSGQEPPVSIIIPARDEQDRIVNAVRSVLQLRYAGYEVIVVNDGSGDATLARLIEAFDLLPVPGALPAPLRTEAVRTCYLSRSQPNLRVIDKAPGGTADALNAGVNASVYPLFCCVDADSILDRDALLHLVQPFIHDPDTVACGGTTLLSNGSVVREGHLVQTALPEDRLARMQIVDNLRNSLFGRVGWSAINAQLLLSGNFALLKKQAVIDCGGYLRDLVSEGMELVLRMHRMLHAAGTPYGIRHVATALCWTEAPRDWNTLKRSRVRWHRGLCESLWLNGAMLFRGRPHLAGWVALPCHLLFDCAAPLIEAAGYLLLLGSVLAGAMHIGTAMLLLALGLGLAVLLSALAVLLEESCFHRYASTRESLALLGAAITGNFGYRQRDMVWRLKGMWQWLAGKRGGRRVTQRRPRP